MARRPSSGGAGYSVADVGDLTGTGYDDAADRSTHGHRQPADHCRQRHRQRLPRFWLRVRDRDEPDAVQNWLNYRRRPQSGRK